MIPSLFFLILTGIVIACAVYFFLVNDRGPVPYADILSCVVGFFLSVFLAINTAAGNIGEKTAVVLTNSTTDFKENIVETTSMTDITNLTMVDTAVSWLFVAAAILFIGCAVYSISVMWSNYKYERSM